MTTDLDRAPWASMTSTLASRADVRAAAARMHADFGPFICARDDSDEAISDLETLVAGHGPAVFLQAAEVRVPTGLRATLWGKGRQMLWDPAARLVKPPARPEVVDLGDADAGEMVALAALTRPGPYAARTHQLGRHLGIRREGRLVAMTGERLRTDGWVEVSAVCTHPDWLGHGFATSLVSAATERIADEGLLPILHVFSTNDRAIAVYERLGYRTRTEVSATRVEAR
ncbi:GNAT family N-acetyltransferase [Myceligenerans indicum]|uniref:GNAT family N-acetyltransferase n=1 Tax=Myceligenerans indicum TaxID=2593663 RepID=A0ABS1LG73_9MICO|nr:GNAT family N-acetyltransferase [Myceligenerans indicum]MBL0885158.1 GNAT family N-acetyltransferase [Myceligenerans indicum]